MVARIVERCLAPASVLDLGCGCGIWLDVLSDGGQRHIQGVEEEAFAPRDLAVDPSHILIASLARPLQLNRSFDLVICLEGPDHVEPQHADILIDNCTRHGDVILFSTALPGQAALLCNKKPGPEYWIDSFRRRGFVDLDLIRPLIWHDPRIPFWFRQNLLMFVKDGSSRLAGLRAEAERVASFSPLRRLESAWPYAVSFAAELDERRLEELTGRLAWQAERLRRAVDSEQASRDEARGLATEVDRLRQEAVTLKDERKILQDHVDELAVYIGSLQREMAVTAGELERTQSAVAILRQERAIILGSTMWRATGPLRALARALPLPVRLRLRQALHGLSRLGRVLTGLRFRRRLRARKPAPATAVDADGDPTPAAGNRQRVLIISGESRTPGHIYRVLRLAKAIEACGTAVSWMRIEEFEQRRDEIAQAQVVMIWRAPYSATTSAIMKIARETGAKVVYDLDDLMLKPELARVDIIDGIRSQGFSTEETARLFERIQKLMLQADICTCTTNELADHIREYQKIAYVLPNGFDEEAHLTSRLAVRYRRSAPEEAVIRIGYAGGSRTHQRDFFQVVNALARVLRERPECRLVLFRDPNSHDPIVNPAEFPALADFSRQIEWRDMIPLARLPAEVARFDINLVPLETGNPFCEAKSELKYFEAALVEVCTVASRSGPLGRAIQNGVTGRLVDTQEAWYDALRELIADKASREKMAHAAYLDVLWRFGPRRREELVQSLLDQLAGGEVAARAFELELRRSNRRVPDFDIPPSEVVFISDNEHPSEVSVILPLYNYAHYVGEALESVRQQTIKDLDLIIVDDCSTDNSLALAVDWARDHAGRFNRIVVLRNRANAGLARSRNVGFDNAETPFVLPLDADNRLLADCCSVMLAALRGSRAAFAYPRIQCFGDANHIIGDEAFSPARFSGGNYVDAMALISKWAWAAVGGYAHIQNGWEDYDFWCRCVEHGFWGQRVSEVLAEYRVHKQSMLKTRTDQHENKLKLIRDLNAGHSWLSIPYRA